MFKSLRNPNIEKCSQILEKADYFQRELMLSLNKCRAQKEIENINYKLNISLLDNKIYNG